MLGALPRLPLRRRSIKHIFASASPRSCKAGEYWLGSKITRRQATHGARRTAPSRPRSFLAWLALKVLVPTCVSCPRDIPAGHIHQRLSLAGFWRMRFREHCGTRTFAFPLRHIHLYRSDTHVFEV